jgi:ribosomal subunit interface protein
MRVAATVNFHHMDPSPALERRIREKIERLDRFFPGMMRCSVTVEAAHHHQRKGFFYSVRIALTLPRGELVVSQHPGKNPRKHDKVFAAMNSAFQAIEKQILRFKALERREVKEHQSSSWQQGEITQLFPEEDFGFIKSPTKDEVYFHMNALKAHNSDKIDLGSKVRFVVIEGEGYKGPQASVVQVLNRKAA